MNTDALTWAEPGPSLARAVAGEFQLLAEIGRGGMGVVYLAQDSRLLRKVAIKTLLPHVAADALVRERFIRESRMAASLTHPGIVPIFAAAEQNGVVYFVMRLVEGESLAERIASSGPLSERDALVIAKDIADALAYAHSAGVIHRDIKAENVLLESASGHAVITDFGIARMGEAQALTATGTVLGSVYYMSPEQVSAEEIDGRSDLYSLGVLLFYMLTARFPFEKPQASAVLVAHVTSVPPKLSDLRPSVSAQLDTLVANLLSKSPADRSASARELSQHLQSLIEAVGEPGYNQHIELNVGHKTERTALSSDEAQEVWKRAADLQAHTGLSIPAPAFTPRDPNSDPLTRGYEIEVIKEAAVEAGIDSKYVERALVEQTKALSEQSDQQGSAVVAVGKDQQSRPKFWRGAHTKLEFEAVIDGEIPSDMFEVLADAARRELGELVLISMIGRTMTITTNGARQSRNNTAKSVHLQVASRNGRTVITGFEDLSALSAGLFGGMMGGAGGGVGAAAFAITMANSRNPLLGLAVWSGTILTTGLIARTLFQRSARKHEKALRETIERLAQMARAQVEAIKLKP